MGYAHILLSNMRFGNTYNVTTFVFSTGSLFPFLALPNTRVCQYGEKLYIMRHEVRRILPHLATHNTHKDFKDKTYVQNIISWYGTSTKFACSMTMNKSFPITK